MCDYSLQALKSRPAVVDDKLIVTNFGTGTFGFRGVENINDPEAMTAVCVLPGTELAFSAGIQDRFTFKKHEHQTAVFRQVHKDQQLLHHDALELPNGEIVMLTALTPDQRATVLQLPATPRNEAEAEEQRRVSVTA